MKLCRCFCLRTAAAPDSDRLIFRPASDPNLGHEPQDKSYEEER